MVDLVVTPADVLTVDGIVRDGIAGAAITQGQPVRASGGQYVPATDNDDANAAAVAGIALQSVAAGQPIRFQESGVIDIGATVAVGKVYVLSTSGAIAPVDDIAGGEFVTVIGVGVTINNIKLSINASGVQAAGGVT